MAMHMSLRLAWHSDGWNGHICKKPCGNTYCVGPYSYPGTLIKVIIANMLVDREIPFKYEELLYAADGTMYLPDFTVTFRGETYYWEHVGMLDRPDYKAHWEKKQIWYEKTSPDNCW